MDEDHEKSELLWSLIESRDRTISKGIKKWDEQDQEIGLLRKTLEERKLELDEKDKEIEFLKRESNEKDEEIEEKDKEIELLKGESNEKDEEIEEKDEEISALKRTLEVRVEKLKELERIRSSWLYQLLHTIRHPRKIFKSRATNDKMSSLKEKK